MCREQQERLEAFDKLPPSQYGINLKEESMSSAGIIIGELLVGVITIFAEKAKAAGMKDEEIKNMLFDVLAQVIDTKPEDLPTGPR